MDRRRLSRAALVGAAALSAAACAQQQPKVAAVSQTSSIAYTAADRECMARAMYFESNRTSSDGMLAVGTIVANRVQSGRYGRTVCDVVGTRGQFAPGVMTRTMSGASADLARASADQVLAGKRHAGVKSALHFHTAGMRFRYPNMHYVLVAGGNAFYEKRDSSGGGRAANARSLALALAVGRADPMKSHAIEVAAATPLESPIAPAVSSVTVTAKPGAAPTTTVVTTQVAQAQPTVPQAAPIQVAQAQPAAKTVGSTAPAKLFGASPARPAAVSATAPVPVQVAAAQSTAAPVPAAAPQRATPAKSPAVARPAEPPVAYAQADAPAVALPKIKPAPKRTISATTEPMLASVAPAKHARATAPARPAAAAEAVQAPTAVAAAPAVQSNASGYVASAFAAFD